jgi:phosphate-selective porin OprO/OprP
LHPGSCPLRDVGVQALGNLAAGRVTYNAGVFGGIPDGTSFTIGSEHGGTDAAGRVTVQPFKSAAARRGPLNGLGFHVGASRGNQSGALPKYRSLKQTYFSYAPGAAAAGNRTRLSPAVFYYFRAFGAFAEYMRSAQRVERDDARRIIDNRAWEITASFVLTGESASDRGVRPSAAFDPAHHRVGALQLVARYAAVTVDEAEAAFDAAFAAAGASRSARQWGVGTNWYPSPWIKAAATFERTVFDDRSTRAPEHVVGLRFQLAF